MQLLIAIVLVLACQTASANAGLPMLFVVWPLSAFALVPVVAVESWVVQRLLNVGWKATLIEMTKANVFSTVIGIPVTWVFLVAVELGAASATTGLTPSNSYPPIAAGEAVGIVLSAPWLGPFTEGGFWKVPLATMALLVPFFLVSGWVEALFVARAWRAKSLLGVRRAVWQANLASYALLLVLCLAWLAWGVANHPRPSSVA